jgi:hypothetical protein
VTVPTGYTAEARMASYIPEIINRTDSPVRVLMLSSMVGPDIVDYIDSGKVYATDLAGEPIMFARPGPTADYLGR